MSRSQIEYLPPLVACCDPPMRVSILALAVLLVIAACSSGSGTAGGVQVEHTQRSDRSEPTAASATDSVQPTSTPVPAPTATPTPAQRYGPELISNGDFESGQPVPQGWFVPDLFPGQIVEWVGDGVYEGDRALRLESAGNAEDWIRLVRSDRIPVSPGSRYWFTARVRTDKAGVFFSHWRYFASIEDETSFTAGSTGQYPVADKEWTEISELMVPQEGATSVEVGVALALNPGLAGLDPSENLTLYVDNLSLRKLLSD